MNLIALPRQAWAWSAAGSPFKDGYRAFPSSLSPATVRTASRPMLTDGSRISKAKCEDVLGHQHATSIDRRAAHLCVGPNARVARWQPALSARSRMTVGDAAIVRNPLCDGGSPQSTSYRSEFVQDASRCAARPKSKRVWGHPATPLLHPLARTSNRLTKSQRLSSDLWVMSCVPLVLAVTPDRICPDQWR